MHDPFHRETPAADTGQQPWKAFAGWLIVDVAAALAALPYLAALRSATAPPTPLGALAPGFVLGRLSWSVFAIGIGLVLGPGLRLGGATGRNRWASLGIAVACGIGIGAVIGLAGAWFERFLVPASPDTARDLEEILAGMAPWKGILVSIAAGIHEELLFRFGAMTLVAWWIAKLTRHRPAAPSDLWIANVSAAVLFGLAHLPNVVAVGVPVTTGIVLSVLLVNGAAGLIFGWLYGRHGIRTAIVAHATADIVLKVVVPLLSSPGT